MKVLGVLSILDQQEGMRSMNELHGSLKTHSREIFAIINVWD